MSDVNAPSSTPGPAQRAAAEPESAAEPTAGAPPTPAAQPTSAVQPTSAAQPRPAPERADRRPRIVGFLCDWAVSGEGLLQEDGTMRDLPNVTLIKVPCSGFVRPSWLEFALRNGADAAFVCGCPLGDCFNRLGNNLIADRVVQMRRRLERQKVQPDRVTTVFYGLHDQAEFVAAVRAFSDHVASLPPPAAPRRPAAGPATASVAGSPKAAAGQNTPPRGAAGMEGS